MRCVLIGVLICITILFLIKQESSYQTFDSDQRHLIEKFGFASILTGLNTVGVISNTIKGINTMSDFFPAVKDIADPDNLKNKITNWWSGKKIKQSAHTQPPGLTLPHTIFININPTQRSKTSSQIYECKVIV